MIMHNEGIPHGVRYSLTSLSMLRGKNHAREGNENRHNFPGELR